MKTKLTNFLKNSLTAYHAVENCKTLLLENGFFPLFETEDWSLVEGGKYFLIRGGSLIAFTVDSIKDFCYKLALSHSDSPALKLKENPVKPSSLYAVLNLEKYGGANWHTYMDRPLRIAGKVVKKENGILKEEILSSPFLVTIPSLAIHQNRSINEGVEINPQIDLQALLSTDNDISNEVLLEKIAGKGVVSYDLYLVNADTPYTFGINDEFFASPRIDNLTSVYASLQALLSHKRKNGVCLMSCMNSEEIGSSTYDGADGDFMKITLKRIANALGLSKDEYYKALANSFLLSIDNAHATHPNHPEKSDPTNKVKTGNGIVIKSHASKAYITESTSSAILKTTFEMHGVPYQTFHNRSDAKSGGTLAVPTTRHLGIIGADIGIAQLAMHSACECFAYKDFDYLCRGIDGYFSSRILRKENSLLID